MLTGLKVVGLDKKSKHLMSNVLQHVFRKDSFQMYPTPKQPTDMQQNQSSILALPKSGKDKSDA
eukprot:1161803-Pelagomonas_calceolata.AAC.7